MSDLRGIGESLMHYYQKRVRATNGNRSVGTHSDISDYAFPSLVIPNMPMAQDYKE